MTTRSAPDQGKRLSGKQWTVKAAHDSSSWEPLCVSLLLWKTREPNPHLSLVLPPVKHGDVKHPATPPHPPVRTLWNSANTSQTLWTQRGLFLTEKAAEYTKLCVCCDIMMLGVARGTPVRTEGEHKLSGTYWQPEKGPLKRLIRPRQARHIKTWWDNRSLQTELQSEWTEIQWHCQEEKVNWPGQQIGKSSSDTLKSAKCYRWCYFCITSLLYTDKRSVL